MRLVLELSDEEVHHMLEALNGVATIIERESYELAAAVIIRNVFDKIVQARRDLE